MALRAVPDHPKFAELKARLKQPKGPTAGWLEMMWHFTGRFTPQGNIGKYSDTAIEAWVEWDGAPGALIEALVDTGWLDRDDIHRLLVHDWADHADKAAKNAIGRSKLDFCTPTVRTEGTTGEHVRTKSQNGGLPAPESKPVPGSVPAPAAECGPVRIPVETKQQQFPQSKKFITDCFPGTGADWIRKLFAKVVAIKPDVDDAQMLEGLHATYRRAKQNTAGLWLEMLPEYFEARQDADESNPGPACKTCGDRRKIFNPKFSGRPNSEWIDLPESEWDIPCPDCAGESAASVPPGTARARDPAHVGGRRAAER